MGHVWANWSGSLRFAPAHVERPGSEEEVVALIRRARGEGRTVRPVGAGHSSTPLVATEDVLVSLERLSGLAAHDVTRCEATLRGGTTLHDAGAAMLAVGLAMPNLGDVDVQTVAGAVATGTHGTGRTLPNLATALVGGRLVTGTGEVVEFAEEREPDLVRAVRVSLGTLGIVTSLRLRVVPAFRLRRREWCASVEECLAHLAELVETNRNFDFYWYPRRDEVKLRTMNLPDEEPADPRYARPVRDEVGWSNQVIPRSRELRFDEMEYFLPAEAGPTCFREVRRRVKAYHRHRVGWRVLYRTVAPDDAYLSPSHGRESVTISLHQNASLPFQEYFDDIEPIFLAHGGRPHWAKKHGLRAAEVRPRYPSWDRFLAARERLDPKGRFLNPYLRELLGVDP